MNKTKMFVVGLVIVSASAFAQSDTNVVWKKSLGLGATYKSGNTDKTLFTTDLKGDRFAPTGDFISSLHGEHGKTDGEKTEGQVRAQAEYRWKLGEKSHWYASANGEALYDELKNIRTRAKFGPNVGYYFMNTEAIKFDVSFGVNYGYQRTVEKEYDFGEYRVAGNYLWTINEMASYYLNIEYSANVEDTEDGSGLLVTGLKSKVSDQMSMSIELRNEYDNTLEDAEYNDVTLIAGLTYDF